MVEAKKPCLPRLSIQAASSLTETGMVAVDFIASLPEGGAIVQSIQLPPHHYYILESAINNSRHIFNDELFLFKPLTEGEKS
jgi:hypothetical protein